MLVEMVDGGLTWRGDREEGVSDAQRKQHILKRKQMALEDPSQWLSANVRLPGEQQQTPAGLRFKAGASSSWSELPM